MTDKEPKGAGSAFWEALGPPKPKLPRTPDAVGVRCAADGCDVTNRITYDSPLCWNHWKDFDNLLIFECEWCHWFDEHFGEDPDELLCFECIGREQRGMPPTPIYAHGPVERRVRFLYVLKLDGGKYYIGETNSLELRLGEHLDDTTISTRGKHPKLVYFEQWHGQTDELKAKEKELTRIAVDNPRVIRRMVEEWQKPYRLVDFGR